MSESEPTLPTPTPPPPPPPPPPPSFGPLTRSEDPLAIRMPMKLGKGLQAFDPNEHPGSTATPPGGDR